MGMAARRRPSLNAARNGVASAETAARAPRIAAAEALDGAATANVMDTAELARRRRRAMLLMVTGACSIAAIAVSNTRCTGAVNVEVASPPTVARATTKPIGGLGPWGIGGRRDGLDGGGWGSDGPDARRRGLCGSGGRGLGGGEGLGRGGSGGGGLGGSGGYGLGGSGGGGLGGSGGGGLGGSGGYGLGGSGGGGLGGSGGGGDRSARERPVRPSATACRFSTACCISTAGVTPTVSPAP
jgi:hypothetical protein